MTYEQEIDEKIEKQLNKCSVIIKREAKKLGRELNDSGIETNNSQNTEAWVLFEEFDSKETGLIIEAKYNIFDSMKMSYEVYIHDEMGDKVRTIKKYRA